MSSFSAQLMNIHKRFSFHEYFNTISIECSFNQTQMNNHPCDFSIQFLRIHFLLFVEWETFHRAVSKVWGNGSNNISDAQPQHSPPSETQYMLNDISFSIRMMTSFSNTTPPSHQLCF